MTKLQQARARKKATIRQAAQAIGISASQLCRIERGAPTTIETAKKIAAFYGRGLGMFK